MWLKQAVAAEQNMSEANSADHDFYAGKLAACDYFFAYELPRTDADLALVASLDDTCYNLRAEQFVGH